MTHVHFMSFAVIKLHSATVAYPAYPVLSSVTTYCKPAHGEISRWYFSIDNVAFNAQVYGCVLLRGVAFEMTPQ